MACIQRRILKQANLVSFFSLDWEGLGVLAVPAWTEELTLLSSCPFLGNHDSFWGGLQVPNLCLVLHGLMSFTLKSGQKTLSQCVLFPGLRCFGIWDQADLEEVPFSGQFPEVVADLPRWLCLPHTKNNQSRLHPLPSIALRTLTLQASSADHSSQVPDTQEQPYSALPVSSEEVLSPCSVCIFTNPDTSLGIKLCLLFYVPAWVLRFPRGKFFFKKKTAKL